MRPLALLFVIAALGCRGTRESKRPALNEPRLDEPGVRETSGLEPGVTYVPFGVSHKLSELDRLTVGPSRR